MWKWVEKIKWLANLLLGNTCTHAPWKVILCEKPNNITSHVDCPYLNRDNYYLCNAQGNENKNCIKLHPGAVEVYQIKEKNDKIKGGPRFNV